ncbi:hypothetical protein [Streptomyces sp. 3214.6]|nr:hypothetical protein [Streptomyces sp. 3214.6]SHH52009.1 hypothetical protein SAMN05444521_0800 [Streptomyces sp. 3214.6]
MKLWARIAHMMDACNMAGTPGSETFTLRVWWRPVPAAPQVPGPQLPKP